MHIFFRLLGVCTTGLLLAGCVAPDAGRSLPRGGGAFFATPPEDGWARIGPFSTLNKDCDVIAVATIHVLEQPRNGRLRKITASGGPGYDSESAFAHCNSRKIAGPFIEYRPRQGYRGTDSFRFEVRFKNGERRLFKPTMNIASN